jgi:hypothetical protein
MTRQATIGRIEPRLGVAGPEDPAWERAEALAIDQFRPEGSDHRPRTVLQLLHDGRSIHGRFHVEDRYVRCRHRVYGDPVYKDSCVELFLKPKPDSGYFSFEFNCGGVFLCNYITDETRVPGGFKAYVALQAEEVGEVQVVTSLPGRVEPEIVGPVSWWLAFRIPVEMLERHVGPVGPLAGQRWRGNTFKCGNETSHPHWASWPPVDRLNFHLPCCFGELSFV